mmetsp:Transcript_108837/g.283819  ORF Transcript_108837/g.283819 Transcript_108837/m.283819 type:complete len:251 (-) Transcript_108837:64-816(-)
MFKKSWMFVTTMSFDFARRFTKIGFSTASGRAISTSTMRPSDMSPKMPSSAPPFTPMRACAFLIIASLAVRAISSLASRSFSLAFLRSVAALRRLSASRRSSFMAFVASFFALSRSLCFSLNQASATLSCCVLYLKSVCSSGMISSSFPVARVKFLFSLASLFLGFLSSEMPSRSTSRFPKPPFRNSFSSSVYTSSPKPSPSESSPSSPSPALRPSIATCWEATGATIVFAAAMAKPAQVRMGAHISHRP